MTRPTPLLWLMPLVLAVMLGGVMIGPIALTPSEIGAALTRQGDPAMQAIIWEIRLPRICSALLVGAALGLSGAALQGVLRNPLAEPGVLGVSAAATTAATGTIYFGLAVASPFLVPLAALGGAMTATALLIGAALRLRSVGSLILLGVAISAFAGAIMALFVNLAPNPFSLSDLINWTAGSVANRDWGDIATALPFFLAGTAVLLPTRAALSAMALGEDVAHGLGVNLLRIRLMTVLGTGLLTGGSVALAGMVGFIGLIAPHVVSASVGHDRGRTLLPAAAAGGLLAGIADTVIRVIPWGSELHLGTLAALIGAPLFILLVWRMGEMRLG